MYLGSVGNHPFGGAPGPWNGQGLINTVISCFGSPPGDGMWVVVNSRPQSKAASHVERAIRGLSEGQ